MAEHLDQVSSGLTGRLESSTAHVAEQLDSVSTALSGRLDSTAERIAGQLANASNTVDASVANFEQEVARVLSTREDSMGGLMERLTAKAESVDQIMQNYMTVIEDSLVVAETRAREVGHALAHQAGLATSSLDEELQRIQAASDEKISVAAATLASQFEQAIDSMNEKLATSSNDFSDTAGKMRAAAQTVIEEITSARHELRTAVADLPDDTRSSADAMRKVVADQITALGALADVVRKHGETVDLSTPGIRGVSSKSRRTLS